ncbi:MAG: TonB-dependent receptor, partial [Candidatus Aminicenantes bacterium]|nr:TonB-dependent receptor [Candidatus Aminicenantes bacterium]
HSSGWTNWPGQSRSLYDYKKWIYGRASANLDFTYYLNLAGEHAFKGGLQYIRPFEDVDASSSHPWVRLYWGAYYPWPTGEKVQGKYGYYELRGSFASAYGNLWTLHSDNWAIYFQDSWTINDRLTLNLGVRTESEYVPAMSKDTTLPGYSAKPIQFGFDQKLAPRLGVVYDVLGDSSLKVFASFGIYYDVMKLYMAEGAYGGFKWQTSYYTLDDFDWTKIAANGDLKDAASQAAGGKYFGTRNWRTGSFQETEPNMKPVSQSEMSFGAEKKLTEEISFSARFVYKHLISTIEDIGYYDADYNEQYFIGNPGEGLSKPVSQGGVFSDDYWEAPKPKREYYGLNLSLEKRFSNNWQGGFSYTWSQMKGNYGGLSSSDEGGRNSPNVERYWDMWFERYDLHGRAYDGILPSDRTHYLKGYGSYAFPFGLTVGVVAYGRSGLPRNTNVSFNDMQAFPDGYYDTGERLPFTVWADVYLEYNLRIAKKYAVNINATISNITNTSTIQGYSDRYNYTMLRLGDEELLAQRTNYKDWKTLLAQQVTVDALDPRFGMWTSRYGPWSWRLGARVSF